MIAYFTPQFTDAEKLVEALTGAMDPWTIISLFAEENRIIVRGDETQRLALIGGFGIEALPQ